MVERSECSVEESSNGASHHDDVSINANIIIKNRFQPSEIINNTNNNRFSIFKWFKRNANASERPLNHHQIIDDNLNVSEVSSSESVDTYYSTATVKSFAFHSGTLETSSTIPINLNILQENQREVGPFASGASKVIGKIGNDSTNVTQTLPANALSRSRDITTRYSLQSCTTGTGSCNNINNSHQCGVSNSLRPLDNHSGERRLHVRGKRRAPNPPVANSRPDSVCTVNVAISSRQRKRRPAPKPPDSTISIQNRETNVMDSSGGGSGDKNVTTKQSNETVKVNKSQQSISNDTLVLRGGVLMSKREISAPIKLPTSSSSSSSSSSAINQRSGVTVGSPTGSAMPRPWYKRSVFENSSKKIDNSRAPGSSDTGDDCISSTSIKSNENHHQLEKSPNEGSLSRLKFFNRDKTTDDKRKDIKRRSGLSILTNISELDKEAAAIVQEEQARTRALLIKQTSLLSEKIEKRTLDNHQEVIQDLVTSAIENSPRRGTRALISKFNAIGNITKVTVNSSFFNKNTYAKDQDNLKVTNDDWQCKTTSDKNSKVHPDLSQYFPQCGSPKVQRSNQNLKSSINESRLSFFYGTNDNILLNEKSEIDVEKKITKKKEDKDENSINDVTNRLTALQSMITKNSFDNVQRSSPIATRSAIKSHKEWIIDDNDDNSKVPDKQKVSSYHENSPKLSRTRVFTTEGEKKTEKIEAIQREFTNIFEAMDKQQLTSTNFNPSNQCLDKGKKYQQVGTSSQVNKVLDILVEKQKIGKNSLLENNQKCESKPRTSLLLNKIEDPTTMGLKEMLKEMKHSLPKRPKPKRTIDKKITAVTTTDQTTESSPSSSNLLNPVKVIYPPIINIAPSRETELIEEKKRNYVQQQHKISSAVQTSGNVRKIITNPLPSSPSASSSSSSATTTGTAAAPMSILSSSPSTSQCQYDNIVYKTMRNKFQLMRPREFAAIGAIKKLKYSEDNDNTYANVIEQSLYANAFVLPSRNHEIIPNNLAWSKKCNKKSKFTELGIDDDESQLQFDDNYGEMSTSLPFSRDYLQDVENKKNNMQAMAMVEKKMNTMAVNRLIRKLEGAIASGNHQQAAGFAKELARLKIQCSVIRHRPKNADILNVDMYIEDRLAHQGPIPLQLPLLMTVAQLKDKISKDFNIPGNVQRWIINNTLAENNDATLTDLRAVEGSPVFLYLVAPDLQIIDPEKKSIPVLDHNNIDQFINNNHGNNIDISKIITDETKKIYVENNNNEESNDDDNDDEDNFVQVVFDPVVDNVIADKMDVSYELPKAPKQLIIESSQPKNPEITMEVECTQDINDIEREGAAAAIIEKTESQGYQKLIMLELCDLVLNTDSFVCPICFDKCDQNKGVILRSCLHTFCRNCLVDTIKHCEDAEVKCPYRDSTYSCQSSIQEREIKALVDPNIYEKHLAKSMSQAECSAGENAFHCKTPNCIGWCVREDKPYHFLCPTCHQTNCLMCEAIHEGQDCQEYQEDIRMRCEPDYESKRTALMFEKMLANGDAMYCPTCNAILTKKLGCDWLKCVMCKTEICWITKGPRWGPNGPGDISGGCKCNVNGIKCHPKCNYCH